MVTFRSRFVSLSRLSLARVCTSRASTARETRRETITQRHRLSMSTSAVAPLHGRAPDTRHRQRRRQSRCVAVLPVLPVLGPRASARDMHVHGALTSPYVQTRARRARALALMEPGAGRRGFVTLSDHPADHPVPPFTRVCTSRANTAERDGRRDEHGT